MSRWTYIKGVIKVSPFGRTQAELRYILETVLAHLTKVTGSEEDMYVHIVQNGGKNEFSSSNEFGEWQKEDWQEIQRDYTLVVEGSFRDRDIETTHKEFMKFLMRLAKRIWVQDCFVKIDDGWKENKIVIDLDDLGDYVTPWSWQGEGTVNWCEYLIWKEPHDSKGRKFMGKPDFPDGACIDLMTKKEKEKRLRLNKKGKRK